MFNKNIENSEEYDDELVHLYSKQPATFNIGYNIVVRPGFNAVFVVKDRVTDVLPSGKYRIAYDGLPLTFHKLKLDKLTDKAMPKKIKADLYFVNINLFKDFAFNGDVPYYNKTKEFGRVVAYAQGSCTMQVQDAGDFVSFLLVDRAYVTNKIATKFSSCYIGNICNKLLEKSKLNIKQIFENPQSATEYLNTNINGYLNDFGVTVSDTKLLSFDVNTRAQKKMGTITPAAQVEQPNLNEDVKTSEMVDDMQPRFIVENSEQSVPEMPNEIENDLSLPSVDNNSINNTNLESETPEIEHLTCSNCGAELQPHAHFCSNCGFKID